MRRSVFKAETQGDLLRAVKLLYKAAKAGRLVKTQSISLSILRCACAEQVDAGLLGPLELEDFFEEYGPAPAAAGPVLEGTA